MQGRDPEAAALLMAQLIVTQEVERVRQQEQGAGLQAVSAAYSPIALYAYVTQKTGWTHHEMALMHYLTFFAYVREFIETDRRERDASKAHQAALPHYSYYASNRTVDF